MGVVLEEHSFCRLAHCLSEDSTRGRSTTQRKTRKDDLHLITERKSFSKPPWKNYLRNPSQICYYLQSQTTTRSQESCWFQEELQRRDLQPQTISAEVKDGEFRVEENIYSKGIHHRALQEEEVTFARKENLEDCQENLREPVPYVALLKACAKRKDLREGCRLHADILKHELQRDLFVGTTLVYMYAKCGAVAKAQEAFDELPLRDIVPWNALISGYTQHGHGKKAVECFEKMQKEGVLPNAVTFSCILKACGSIKAVEKGQIVHDQISKGHLLETNIVVANALIDMYGKCGLLEKAQGVFDEISNRNVVTWNTLIAAYAEHGHGEKAIHCFEEMHLQGLSPNAITYVCILKACGSIEASDMGQEIHAQISREGLLEKDTVVGTALVDMYFKCGLLEKGQEVFDKISTWDVAAWNALVAGYAQHMHGEEALVCFEEMQRQGFLPDAATFACILKACGDIGAPDKGQKLHAYIIRAGLLGKNVVVANALVDMYAKCGLLAKAREVFDTLSVQDTVSWNVLVAGYAQHLHEEEALNHFDQMQLQGFFPDEITFACTLKACSSIGAAHKGQVIHDKIVKEGFQGKTIVGNALVDMYASCGMIAEAQIVFDRLGVWDVVSWNSLMSGYAQVGKSEVVFNLFDKMIEEGIKPNTVTFTIVLNTCSHGGLVDKGQTYFQIMSTWYGIIPAMEHHTCMIDLFGRVGHLDKAIAMTKVMPLSADFTLSQSVLAAYRNWRVIEPAT